MNNLLTQFEKQLQTRLTFNNKLFDAMNYSLLAGGKRFRPMLLLCLATDFDIEAERMFPIANALEMIHTYSLIHDDLPALDDDEMRRGVPTNHVVYGEDVAILAGDGLLTHAFFELTKSKIEDREKVEIIELFSLHAGPFGMVLGQINDMEHDINMSTDFHELEQIHRLKTGKLIELSVVTPCIVAKKPDYVITEAHELGKLIGLWFQIRDDIMDVTESSETLGKTANSDIRNQKLTYVSHLGLDGARKELKACQEQIFEILNTNFPNATNLKNYLSEVM